MNNNDDAILFILLVILGVGAYGVWQFSTYFGLDMPTGFSVLLRLGGVAIATGLFIKVLDMSLKNTWPLILAGLFMAWWPGIDYWSTHLPSMPDASMVEYGVVAQVWWSTGWFKVLGLIGIVGGGYTINWCLDNR